ncbi:MAG: phenylacetate-CoA oxygenase subunit PaaJ [Ignavibacteriae bacterium]|nr:phenylacetate-CoA oxygenase subunit PaaJ [Ignavibacteriota bacterium]MCB9243494.1 phenylacetate-CoA oxygenase subunit PaaJ [Ignavibacteriales bacterium]
MLTKEKILTALHDVKDPEIPKLSVVDLGVITGVEILSDNTVGVTNVRVQMTPTFAGCPALNVMKDDIKTRLEAMPEIDSAEVNVSFDTRWSTDMITDEGRRILKESGFAPPHVLGEQLVQIDILKDAECPFCGSKDTELRNSFGPTLCRAIHYCNHCKQAFEQFKPV